MSGPPLAAMKVELCSFSEYKTYPGHGRRFAQTHGKVFQFLNAKCESAFLSKRNPRQINWTVLYRRKHKKGQSVSETHFVNVVLKLLKLLSVSCCFIKLIK